MRPAFGNFAIGVILLACVLGAAILLAALKDASQEGRSRRVQEGYSIPDEEAAFLRLKSRASP